MAFACYTIRAAREINDPVFSSSYSQLLCFVVKGVLTSHTSCSFVKGSILVEHALWFSLLDHRGKLMRMPASAWVHRIVQSPMSGTKPHQNNLLLPRQRVIVNPLRPWHCDRSDEGLFAEADIVDMLFSSDTLLFKDLCSLISWYFTAGWNPL